MLDVSEAEKGRAAVKTFSPDQMIILRAFRLELVLALIASGLLAWLISLAAKMINSQNHHLISSMGFVFCFIVINFLLNVFSSILAIDLVRPLPVGRLPFETLLEMTEKISNGKCTFVLEEGYNNINDSDFLPILFPSGRNPIGQKLREAYFTNPPIPKRSRAQVVEQVLSSNLQHCFVGIDFERMSQFYTMRNCRLRKMDFPEIAEISYVYYHMLPGNQANRLHKIMNYPSIRGFDSFLHRKYINHISVGTRQKCDLPSGSAVEWSPLETEKIAGSLTNIVLAGLVIGILALGFEKLIQRFHPANFYQLQPLPRVRSSRESMYEKRMLEEKLMDKIGRLVNELKSKSGEHELEQLQKQIDLINTVDEMFV